MSAKKAGKSRARKQTSSSEIARKATPKGKVAGATAKRRPLSPLEVQLRKTMAEMGLARARRVVASVEAAFDD
ncbi:MAG: hypothetical protein K0R38_380 [Polyangiaceae bacterium]|nr:hypothetical protein [Polyangiaceae bacterium]